MLSIEPLDEAAVRAALQTLGTILIDCVEGGASIGFVLPITPSVAQDYWEHILPDLGAGSRILLGAWLTGQLVGSVQLELAQKPNAAHRAEIQKLMVHRSARRQGVGEALMRAVETRAQALGRTLLVLDTAGDAAEKLYLKLGYSPGGSIPQFAIHPEGQRVEPTLFMYKLLRDWQPG